MASKIYRSILNNGIKIRNFRSIHRSAGSTKWTFVSPILFRPIVQFKLSDIGEGIAEVQIKEWHVKLGDHVNQFDDLCEVQSDKATVTITSRYDGIVKKMYYSIDDTASVGRPLVDIELDDDANVEEASEAMSEGKIHEITEEIENTTEQFTKKMGKTLATPAVRRIAKENQLIVDRLVVLRDQLKDIASEKGIKMSYMPLFIKATSLALNEFQILNSSLNADLQSLTYKNSHNICVAMDTVDGLVVPNIKDCQSKNVWEIAAEMHRLQMAGNNGQLAPYDLKDGTFTLSNIGVIGGTYVNPVIFPPQVAIGAIGKLELSPKFDADMQVYAANVLKISWAADHRVVDGATMARFSNLVKKYLQNPALMIAEMR